MSKIKIKSEKDSAIKGPNLPSRPPWQLQTAKARFSELFRRARAEGPQYVTRQGKEAVVVVPAEEFERLTGRSASLEAWSNSSRRRLWPGLSWI